MNSGARVRSPLGLPSSAISYSCRIVGLRSTRLKTAPVIRRIETAPPRRQLCVRGIQKLHIIDVASVVTPNILLGDETRCPEWTLIIWIYSWVEFADKRQGAQVAPSRFAAARRVPPQNESFAALGEVP